MYAKVFASLWDGSLGTKWQGWTVFVYMLANCDREGYFDVTPEAMSARSGLPLQVVKDGIQLLESEDPSSRSPECGGARIERVHDHRDWGWRIVNYQHYRTLADHHIRREQWRRAQEKRRQIVAAQRPSSSVINGHQLSSHAEAEADAVGGSIPQTPSTSAKAEADKEARESFVESFWPEYPRKEAKAAAMKAFVKRCRCQEDFDSIMEGLSFYVSSVWREREPDKIPHASTWLNQERYKDLED